jgi:allophanate hydrolase
MQKLSADPEAGTGTAEPRDLRFSGGGVRGVRGVRDLLRAYHARSADPVETADLICRRIGARGDDHVWITRVDPTSLRARGAELMRLRAAHGGLARLPLYGVPFAVKDNIDVAGMPTTAGCPAFARVAEATAPVVQRLLDAGAMLVGKTNLDQFATGLTGARSPYGACESVYGGGLIAGGSSSGSAVAVASGVVAFSLGTDTAGSGRVPAALNGIVGVKPTRGLLSTRGVVPACRSLDCVSVFARDVADAAAVLDVVTGPDPDDPWSRAGPAGDGRARVRRLGVPRDADLDFFGDLGQRDQFAAGRRRATDLVGRAEPVDLGPLIHAGDLLYRGPWVAERLAGLQGFLRANPAAVLPVIRDVLATGRRYDAVDAFRARHRLQEIRAWTDRLWERIDALVLPTVGTTFTLAEVEADPIGRNTMLGRYTQFANLLDLAAVTVPNGFTADGRPASLTLVGPAFSDARLARLAAELTGEDRPADRSDAAPGDGSDASVTLAVVGRHLRGESRNGELVERGATLVGPARTAPCYRLYALGTGLDAVPGLVRVADGGAAIDVELWRIPATALGSLLAGVGPPLTLGRVRLDTGAEVVGFLCEAYACSATAGATDISAAGGWRAYRAAAPTDQPVDRRRGRSEEEGR